MFLYDIQDRVACVLFSLLLFIYKKSKSFVSFRFVSERTALPLQNLMNDIDEQAIQNCLLAVKTFFFPSKKSWKTESQRKIKNKVISHMTN